MGTAVDDDTAGERDAEEVSISRRSGRSEPEGRYLAAEVFGQASRGSGRITRTTTMQHPGNPPDGVRAHSSNLHLKARTHTR